MIAGPCSIAMLVYQVSQDPPTWFPTALCSGQRQLCLFTRGQSANKQTGKVNQTASQIYMSQQVDEPPKKNREVVGIFFSPFQGWKINKSPAMIFNGPKKKELVAAPNTPFMQVRKSFIKKKTSNDTQLNYIIKIHCENSFYHTAEDAEPRIRLSKKSRIPKEFRRDMRS